MSPCGSRICAVDAHGFPVTCCRLAASRKPPWHGEAAHGPQHVRPIVRQPAARVGETVRVLSERQRRRARDGADLRGGCSGPAGDLQSRRPRVGVGAERLPAMALTFVDRDDEAVVLHRVIRLIRQQEAAICRVSDEHQHRHGPAIEQRPRVLAVLATDVGPADEVTAILVNVGDRQRETVTDLTIGADGVLVGARRARGGIEQQVLLRIDDGDAARVATSCLVVRAGGSRGCAGMEWGQLSGQHALLNRP